MLSAFRYDVPRECIPFQGSFQAQDPGVAATTMQTPSARRTAETAFSYTHEEDEAENGFRLKKLKNSHDIFHTASEDARPFVENMQDSEFGRKTYLAMDATPGPSPIAPSHPEGNMDCDNRIESVCPLVTLRGGTRANSYSGFSAGDLAWLSWQHEKQMEQDMEH